MSRSRLRRKSGRSPRAARTSCSPSSRSFVPTTGSPSVTRRSRASASRGCPILRCATSWQPADWSRCSRIRSAATSRFSRCFPKPADARQNAPTARFSGGATGAGGDRTTRTSDCDVSRAAGQADLTVHPAATAWLRVTRELLHPNDADVVRRADRRERNAGDNDDALTRLRDPVLQSVRLAALDHLIVGENLGRCRGVGAPQQR